MKTQPLNQKDAQPNLEVRIRAMRTLWIGMLLTIGLYYGLTLYAGRRQDIDPNPTLSLILIGVGVMTTLISFVIKSRLLPQAVEERQPQQVQQAYVVSWALTEVASLLGLVDFFATGHAHYYLLFIIGACGLLLHFPRREHVLNAALKPSMM